MLMQNFGMTNKEYYGMLWYFLEWSINDRSLGDGPLEMTGGGVTILKKGFLRVTDPTC